MAESFVPPASVAAAAKRALALRAEQPPSRRGMTPVGIRRAAQLSNREPVSVETLRRMVSFFARHEVDKAGEGFRVGQTGYPSKGLQGWLGWGGDPGRAWARRVLKTIDSEGA